MTKHYYAVLSREATPLAQRFDTQARRDGWVSDAAEAGLDASPASVKQARSWATRMTRRLDVYFGSGTRHESLPDPQAEYYRRNPWCDHHEGHDMTPDALHGYLKPYLHWHETNAWEMESWNWWTPLESPSDRGLAERLAFRLNEVKRDRPDDRIVGRMRAEIAWLTEDEAGLLDGESLPQGWFRRHAVGWMNDDTRRRMSDAVGARSPDGFEDMVYKLGLFL